MTPRIRLLLAGAGLALGALIVAPSLSPAAATGPRPAIGSVPTARNAVQGDFVTIASSRTMDSRVEGDGTKLGRSIDGFFAPLGVPRFVQSELNGSAENQFPNEAIAVTYNVTVTETEGAGFVQVEGNSFSDGATSTVNWTGPGVTVANSGVARLTSAFDDPAALGVFLGGSATARAHVVLDITGFYMPADSP